ncbi:MAG: SusE domain-containing protein [Bacteroidota bacterium]
MKKTFHHILIVASAVLMFAACKKDATFTYLDKVDFPLQLTASTNNVKLSPANTDSTVMAFSWPAVIFKIAAPVSYKLQFDVPADTIGSTAWNNAVIIDAGDDVLGKSFKGIDLNSMALTKFNLTADSASTLVVRTIATLDRKVYSNTVAFTVIPYKSVVLRKLYIPGEYQGWNPSTAPVITEVAGRPNLYEGYVYLKGSGTRWFKYTSDPDWNHINYGDGGGGSFSTDGNAAGLNVADGGYYYLTANLNTNKWTATKTTWSIIGDATPGGWGSDTQLTYNEAKQVWEAVADMSSGGSFKFRANNAWDLDFGIDGTTKELVYADNPFLGYTPNLWNLSVPQTGNYTITLDLHVPGKYVYELKKN